MFSVTAASFIQDLAAYCATGFHLLHSGWILWLMIITQVFWFIGLIESGFQFYADGSCKGLHQFGDLISLYYIVCVREREREREREESI